MSDPDRGGPDPSDLAHANLCRAHPSSARLDHAKVDGAKLPAGFAGDARTEAGADAPSQPLSADLANGFANSRSGQPGYSWMTQPPTTRASRPARRLWTDMDGRNLATDQMVRRCIQKYGPCPPRACQESHPRRSTVSHGATGSAHGCAAAGPPVAATSFASRGSGVRVPLAPQCVVSIHRSLLSRVIVHTFGAWAW
jgi:hypothetical protein